MLGDHITLLNNGTTDAATSECIVSRWVVSSTRTYIDNASTCLRRSAHAPCVSHIVCRHRSLSTVSVVLGFLNTFPRLLTVTIRDETPRRL